LKALCRLITEPALLQLFFLKIIGFRETKKTVRAFARASARETLSFCCVMAIVFPPKNGRRPPAIVRRVPLRRSFFEQADNSSQFARDWSEPASAFRWSPPWPSDRRSQVRFVAYLRDPHSYNETIGAPHRCVAGSLSPAAHQAVPGTGLRASQS